MADGSKDAILAPCRGRKRFDNSYSYGCDKKVYIRKSSLTSKLKGKWYSLCCDGHWNMYGEERPVVTEFADAHLIQRITELERMVLAMWEAPGMPGFNALLQDARNIHGFTDDGKT